MANFNINQFNWQNGFGAAERKNIGLEAGDSRFTVIGTEKNYEFELHSAKNTAWGTISWRYVSTDGELTITIYNESY